MALEAFSKSEMQLAKRLLANQVASMMGRKLEESDWTSVYCRAKGIPEANWSNLHIDVAHNGVGIEMKLLRCGNLNGKTIRQICGTTRMHPAATRSIRISDPNANPRKVLIDIFRQYAELIDQRAQKVRETSKKKSYDIRTGWMLWEDSLSEFLYFEERMIAPDPSQYFAEWSETPARGTRKASKSLWIFEKQGGKKRFSVTTAAGIKIQPYFDIPVPSDPNLYYFQVQGERIGPDSVRIWITPTTATLLRSNLPSFDKETISKAILELSQRPADMVLNKGGQDDLVEPIIVSSEAYERLKGMWATVSDEHSVQLLARALNSKNKR